MKKPSQHSNGLEDKLLLMQIIKPSRPLWELTLEPMITQIHSPGSLFALNSQKQLENHGLLLHQLLLEKVEKPREANKKVEKAKEVKEVSRKKLKRRMMMILICSEMMMRKMPPLLKPLLRPPRLKRRRKSHQRCL